MSEKKSSPAPVKTAKPSQAISSDQVTKLIRMCVILSFATVISLIATAFALHSAVSSKIVTIATDDKGRVTPIVPLNEPLLSEPRVVAFAEECVRRAFSHDFLHYGETMVAAQGCFTYAASAKYVESMQSYLKLMEEKRMVMAIVVKRPPRVIRAYEIDGVVHWNVQVEVELSFEGRNERIPPTGNRIELTIRRVPLEETVRGVAIDALSLGPLT